jgi:hypothetical protein
MVYMKSAVSILHREYLNSPMILLGKPPDSLHPLWSTLESIVMDRLKGETVLKPKYSSTPVPTGNMFHDLLQLRKSADKTERYI